MALETRSAHLELLILGPVEIVGPGGSVRPPGDKPAAVLGLLALHAGELVSRDRLVDTLWPEAPPATAAASLQMHVARVRKLLDDAGYGRDRLATQRNGYVLHVETDELDALRFRALAAEGRRAREAGDAAHAAAVLSEALALWRGELLDGVGGAEMDAQRGRFRELRLQVLEDRFDAELALGHHADVAAELEHAVAEEPHRERLRELAMLALYRSGRQADALALYRSGWRALRDVGLEPSPRLRELEQAILHHDSSLEIPAVETEAPPVRHRRRPAVVAAAVAALIVVVAIVAARELSGGGRTVSAAPNSVAVLDSGGHLVSDVRVGDKPSAVVVGPSTVWVLNGADGTVTRIDPHTLATRNIGVGTSATSLAYGDGALWVGSDQGLLRVDPSTNLSTPISLDRERGHLGTLLPRGVDGLTAAHGVWVTAGLLSPRLFRIADGRAQRRPGALGEPSGPLAYADGALWSAAGGVLSRLALDNGTTTSVPVDSDAPNGFGGESLPQQVVAGSGFVWVTAPYAGEVVAVSPRTRAVAATARVPGRPVSVAYGLGSVWVGTVDGTVSRVDPAATTVTKTVRLGGPVDAIATGYGRVWAAVSR